MPPLEDAEELHKVGLEHAGGRSEEPMRGVDEFEVLFTVEVPHLRHEGFFRVDDATDFFFEGADDHGVGHSEGEWMMKLHFLVYFLKVLVSEQVSASRVMALESGDIEDVVI